MRSIIEMCVLWWNHVCHDGGVYARMKVCVQLCKPWEGLGSGLLAKSLMDALPRPACSSGVPAPSVPQPRILPAVTVPLLLAYGVSQTRVHSVGLGAVSHDGPPAPYYTVCWTTTQLPSPAPVLLLPPNVALLCSVGTVGRGGRSVDPPVLPTVL